MNVGVVIIGRNEGERLRRSIESVAGNSAHVVYVDSCSSDGSADWARSRGVDTVELNESSSLTAARGRNAGFERLMQTAPDIELVFFIDGDCAMADGWLDHAAQTFAAHDDVAIVCGRLREQDRERSVYHRLLDIEWDAPIGDLRECGGVFVIRAALFAQVNGFETSLRAGEEADLCRRLIGRGHRVVRTAQDMAQHDANMTRFSQWWRRCARTGYGYMEATSRGDVLYRRNVRSFVLWGITLPLVSVAAAWPTYGLSLLLWLGYPVLWWRCRRHASRDHSLYATFIVLAKFPEAIGGLKFYCSPRLDPTQASTTVPGTSP